MKIAVTGTPGSGKTTLGKNLANYLSTKCYNEKDLAIKEGLGQFNEENEFEIPIDKLEKRINLFLKKEKNIVIEGHLLCEMKLNIDKIILVKINPEELESRLENRHYPIEKIMDNVFCEGINYCEKYAKRNYKKDKIIEIESQKTQKETLALVLAVLQKK